MEKKILIVQNVSRERPGFIIDLLHEYNIAFDRVDLQRGDKIPDLEPYAAMMVLGGPDSANDESEKMAQEREAVKQWLVLARPYLGICLGHQVLVKMAGGGVLTCPKKEIGFRDEAGKYFTVSITEEGRQDPLFRGILDKNPTVFQLHGEMVEVTDDMVVLATGDVCPVQAVRVGKNAYGLQCHFELTQEMLETWMDEHPELRKRSREDVMSDFVQFEKDHTVMGKQIFTNFLTLAGLRT